MMIRGYIIRSVLALVFFATASILASQQVFAALSPYDSVQQRVIDGIIDDGVILLPPGTEDPRPLIREQLRYMLGQLNWLDAAPRVSWFTIEIGKQDEPDSETGFIPLHYKARGHVAWSKEQDEMSEIELILPARGDQKGIHSFVNRYFHACTNDPLAERRGYYFFFYPSLKTCPMHRKSSSELERERGWVARFPMRFEENDSNTEGQSPEYGELWKDRRLVVTAIFGKFKADAQNDADDGVQAYRRFYSLLLSAYGNPSAEREAEDGDAVIGAMTVHRRPLSLVWRRGESELVVHLALVPSVSGASDSFIRWYQKRTEDSDVVIYNGHAGLGDNVEILAEQARFRPRKYQIFFVNGCDTFTYLNEKLFAAHGAATPDAPVSRYLDIITNSVSNQFNRMAGDSFNLVDALVKKKKTYREILKKFDPKQRSIVDGEQDNAWPNPFSG